ncbi:hypothetical protein BDP27DRAFT_1436460 [Rhodocollybia butyracea]|uniref:F-box domain-containing protein n=1 Tax=Rhodocollybia butyracea TaxID=206335 RepID=A0A9P5P6P5_9AGAR|nr:hypothetical protein BDP27DRAFT_1436460 [Rhodocollybia butyracea]
MEISSVCSRWRELALSSPSLWANIKVVISIDSYETRIGERSMVARYLEMSGDWPLSLAIIVQDRCSTVTPFLIPDLFIRHAVRWKTFVCVSSQSLMEYKKLSRLHFPLLSRVDICNTATSSDLDCFEHSPRLCALASRTVPTSKILCSRLDHLKFHVGPESMTELAETLHRCPSLKSLELTYITTQPDVDLEQGTLGTWRNITLLAFVDGSISLKWVFSSFNFPSLNKLVVHDVPHHTPWPADAFISFVSRSSCMITSLTLRGACLSVSDSDLIAALRVMPDLLHLEVFYGHYEWPGPITSYLISSLTQQQSSVSLVPKLHSLFLKHADTDFDDQTFIKMVESRWFKPGSDLSMALLMMGRACIRSVVLMCDWRELNAETYKPLRNLDAEGLRVVISGMNAPDDRALRTMRVNLSSAELSEIDSDLRSEFGPFVIRPERAEEVKGILALVDEDIDGHDSDIVRLRDQIMIIEAQKQQLEVQRAKLRALLSPMRKLPNELLFRILQQGWDGKDDALTSSPTTSLPAMTISSVCSRWRELALSSPGLWSNMTVEIYSMDMELDNAGNLWLTNMVTRYLERSEQALTLLNHLTEHAHRWKTFKYQGNHSLRYLQILAQLDFPLLLELDINSAPYLLSDLDNFEHASRLCLLSTNVTPPPLHNHH